MSQRLAWLSLKPRLHPNRFFDPDFDFLSRVSNLPTTLLCGTPEHTSYFMDSPFWHGILPSFPCSGKQADVACKQMSPLRDSGRG